MVRIKSPSDEKAEATDAMIEHADWMGANHLSAREASVRGEMMAAITLGEGAGRMTVFEDGDHDDYPRDALGGVGRPTD